MTSIPSNLIRVPNLLSTQVLLSNLNKSQSNLLETQIQMASGKRVNRPSDDIISASLINILENEMDRREHRFRALSHADAALSTLDQSLGEVSDLVLEAKSIASEMVNTSVDEETRRNHATIVDSLIDELFRAANRDYQGLHFFSGERSSVRPIESLLGGYKFVGTEGNLMIDLDRASGLPLTLSAQEAFGAVTSRVQGNVDLSPDLTANTRLRDLNGANGNGVNAGSVNIDLNGLDEITVDLSDADSVQDVADAIQDAINQYEIDNGVTLLDPGGVGISAATDSFTIDVVAGVTITISDPNTGTTASDLGLSQSAFTNASANGADIDPRITQLTQISDLSAITGLGDFVIANAGQIRTISLASAETVQDLQNIVHAANIGVRVEISEDGNSINVRNDLSGGAMQIYESGSGTTAEQLGIRSLTRDIPLSEFNNGRGIQILSGNVDPETGQKDPAFDRDFQITLSDGSSFDVDLAGAETLGDVIDIIDAAAPGTFTVDIDPNGGGLVLTDGSGGTGDFTIEPLNGSFAAQDLGIQKQASGATIAGDDRAKVEVDGLFSHLIALRDALLENDVRGITFAGEALEEDVDRAAQARAIVGQRINRVQSIQEREENEQLLDASLRSEAEDLDFAEAAVRFSQLQTFLQAAMTSGAQSQTLSLLNFLR